MDRQLRAVDLFCGPGGVTTGYKAAGVSVVAAVDIDPSSRSTYAANHPEVKLFGDDLLNLKPEDLISPVGLCRRELDILTACAPCQTYSSLSRSRVDKETTGTRLVLRIGDFVEALEPRALVMENVPDLQKSAEFRKLLERLDSLMYSVWINVVNAADFGVPQSRRRLVEIGLRQ